ncbi:MAG: hypothetical protein CL927_20830 [Deltaproteobacteria bacterium]|nr:hypothetical protein [Deltaproteobacteria bacterium]HCH65661.1 hypothetical protein [Deltaproteobacteria bacterium]
MSRVRRLDFGRPTRPSRGPQVRIMAALLACVVGMVWWVRQVEGPGEPVVGEGEVLVEVRGDVEAPGLYPLASPITVEEAVLRAGTQLRVPDRRIVAPGTAIAVADGVATLQAMEDPLVIGLPLDLNTATAAALVALPGVGASRAEAIVDERRLHGPFSTIDDLERVHGIGPKTVEQLRAFVMVQTPD